MMGNDAQTSAGGRRCTRCGKTPSERMRIAAASPGGLSFLTCLHCTYTDRSAPTIADDAVPVSPQPAKSSAFGHDDAVAMSDDVTPCNCRADVWGDWSRCCQCGNVGRTKQRQPCYGELRRDLAAVTRERDELGEAVAQCKDLSPVVIALRMRADDIAGRRRAEADLAATRERLIDAEAELEAVRRDLTGFRESALELRATLPKLAAAEARVRELEAEQAETRKVLQRLFRAVAGELCDCPGNVPSGPCDGYTDGPHCATAVEYAIHATRKFLAVAQREID